MMQVPVEDVVTFAICIGGTGRQMDHGRHVPRLRPVVSEWARFAPPPSVAVHRRPPPSTRQFVAMLARWSAWPALVNFCGRDVEWMWRAKERRESNHPQARPGVDCGLWMQRLP
jgi:hypothetical protein